MRHNIYNCHRSQISIISSSEYKLYQSIRWQVLPPAITEAEFRRRKLVWDSRIWRQGDLTGSKSVVTQEVMLIGILYNVYGDTIQYLIQPIFTQRNVWRSWCIKYQLKPDELNLKSARDGESGAQQSVGEQSDGINSKYHSFFSQFRVHQNSEANIVQSNL